VKSKNGLADYARVGRALKITAVSTHRKYKSLGAEKNWGISKFNSTFERTT